MTPRLLSNDEIDDGVSLALASVLGQRNDCRTIAKRVADYCTATLRDPRSMYAANARYELADVVALLDEDGRDTGCTMQYADLHYRWVGIAHETLHLILGDCPDHN